ADGGRRLEPRANEGGPGRSRAHRDRRPRAPRPDEVDRPGPLDGREPAARDRRLRAPGAGDHEPGGKCHQVLRRGKPRLGTAGRRRPGPSGETAAPPRGRGRSAGRRVPAGAAQRAGHRHRPRTRHLLRRDRKDLHAVLPRREGRRQRPRAGDQPPDRPGARRRDPREQQAGRRHHLHGRASRGAMMRVPLRERARILIVEDDPDQAEALSAVLAAGEREILVAADGETGLLLARAGVELIVADYMLPGMNGVQMVRRLREEKIATPVLIVSGEATVAVAVEAMKAGVLDFVQKPFDVDFFRARVAQALEMGRTARELVALRRKLQQRHKSELIVGVSPAIAEVRRLIGTVARTDVDVALYGETGTGKELAARAVHEHSLRGEKPFVVVDCAALPEPLLENELFGHEAGAYTGADKHARGLPAEADGGTVFIDEIGEMPLVLQSKLLRFLQTKEFR